MLTQKKWCLLCWHCLVLIMNIGFRQSEIMSLDYSYNVSHNSATVLADMLLIHQAWDWKHNSHINTLLPFSLDTVYRIDFLRTGISGSYFNCCYTLFYNHIKSIEIRRHYNKIKCRKWFQITLQSLFHFLQICGFCALLLLVTLVTVLAVFI